MMSYRFFAWSMFGLGMAAALGLGCDSKSSPTEASQAPQKVEFKVDSSDVYYMWRTPKGRMSAARSLSEIPLAGRPAVAVFVAEKTPRVDEAGGYYVANMLDADPGETMEAVLREEMWLNRAGRASDRAVVAALGVKSTVTPTTPSNKRNDGKTDHELRKWEVELGDIDAEPKEVRLFEDNQKRRQTPKSEAPKKDSDQIEKVVGSRRADPQTSYDDGERPVTERALEGTKIGERDNEPQIQQDGADSDQEIEAQEGRRGIRQKLKRMYQGQSGELGGQLDSVGGE